MATRRQGAPNRTTVYTRGPFPVLHLTVKICRPFSSVQYFRNSSRSDFLGWRWFHSVRREALHHSRA